MPQHPPHPPHLPGAAGASTSPHALPPDEDSASRAPDPRTGPPEGRRLPPPLSPVPVKDTHPKPGLGHRQQDRSGADREPPCRVGSPGLSSQTPE